MKFVKELNVNVPTISKLKLTEISLVDRPANPECIFAVAKMDEPLESALDTQTTATGGSTLERLTKALSAFAAAIGLVSNDSKELTKVLGNEEATATLVDAVGKLDDNGKLSFFKSLSSMVDFDLSKAMAPTKGAAEPDEDDKNKNKQNNGGTTGKTETPEDLSKALSEVPVIKEMQGTLGEIGGVLKQLAGDEGIKKMVADGVAPVQASVEKVSTETTTALEAFQKSVEEFDTRLKTLEDSRGIRRSAGGSGDDSEVGKLDGWGGTLFGVGAS